MLNDELDPRLYLMVKLALAAAPKTKAQKDAEAKKKLEDERKAALKKKEEAARAEKEANQKVKAGRRLHQKHGSCMCCWGGTLQGCWDEFVSMDLLGLLLGPGRAAAQDGGQGYRHEPYGRSLRAYQ
jgi:hypothetical protein